MRGRVKSFSLYNGYGFIKPADSSTEIEEYFFHESNIQSRESTIALQPGTPVEFEVVEFHGRLRAKNIRLVEQDRHEGSKPVPQVRGEPSFQFNRVVPKPLRVQSDNPFQPQTPIVDPSKFSGRGQNLVDAVNAVSRGQSILIAGERGIGKTSFANQISSYLRGDTSLIAKLGSAVVAPRRFFVVDYYCQAGSSIEDIKKGLVARLEAQTLGVPTKRKLRISLPGFTREDVVETSQGDDFFVRFLSSAKRICNASSGHEGLAVCIDEIDQIDDTANLGDLAKGLVDQCGKSGVALILVLTGVLGSALEKLKEHKSALRTLQIIPLRIMSDEEIAQLVEDQLQGTSKSVDGTVAALIAHYSGGFPSPAHLIGLHAFDYAEKKIIDKQAFENALGFIINDIHGVVFGDMLGAFSEEYMKIVAALCAQSDSLSVSELCQRTNIGSPAMRTHLGRLNSDNVVVSTSEGGVVKWRIADPLFKIYATMALSHA